MDKSRLQRLTRKALMAWLRTQDELSSQPLSDYLASVYPHHDFRVGQKFGCSPRVIRYICYGQSRHARLVYRLPAWAQAFRLATACLDARHELTPSRALSLMETL